ncbi:UDP-N-acetylglucosamine 1-carboxyvinyltransferase [Cerasicoccus maritimus]|uniref:UDP-N-acetylglucosamine 1-carboxyvinyltransferase n=1 Tax=Cerasicoccus maritimus TaxID=490089 RepID=UPI002852503A|nr:UDP-N-acetylglucosamine 1-carboxyvinyltransferase [Cerasicoccus maritimus]
MDVFRINGGRPLRGEVTVSGAKNACLPIFAATLLTGETCVIENVPDLSDLRFMAEIIENLGAKVERPDKNTWRITAANITHRAPYELVRRMRASVCLLGPLVARLKKAEVSLPGGCVIGPRPIDLHLKGLSKLNCEVDVNSGYVHVDAKNARGGHVFLGGRHGSTVTGTANILMAAVLTPGVTRIESAACEPEVVDLCKMLISMGADIQGVGSHCLTIEGVDRLKGTTYRVIDDRIEAGTYLIAGAMLDADITVNGAHAEDLSALLDKLEEAGANFSIELGGRIRIQGKPGTLTPVDVITLPHPGYPTDLQAQMCTLMSVTPGLSIITERVYPNRFMHVPELQRMGADIAIEGASAIVKGRRNPLSGAPVMASDLRASAALILAAMAAEGETWVQRIYHLDRGYDGFEKKLQALGADIERLKQDVMPKDLSGEG